MAQILIKKTGNTVPYNAKNYKMYASWIEKGLAEITGEPKEVFKTEAPKKKVEVADVVEPTPAPAEPKKEVDYGSLTYKELKELAKERDLKLKANIKKAELVELLK